MVWCNGTTFGLGNSWWLRVYTERCDATAHYVCSSVIAHMCVLLSVGVWVCGCVWVWVCVHVNYWERVREGKSFFSTWRRLLVFSKPKRRNQQWRGCDVIVRFSQSTCGPTSHATLVSLSCCLCLYFRGCFYVSLRSVCLSADLSVSFFPRLYLLPPLSFHCWGVGVHCLFFYEWDVLFTLWQSYLCQRWWWTHTVWPHFLLSCPSSSDWLTLSPQW